MATVSAEAASPVILMLGKLYLFVNMLVLKPTDLCCMHGRTQEQVLMLVTIMHTYHLLDSNTRENAGGSFLKNVSEFLQDYMQSHPSSSSTQESPNGYL
jgi:hypothetical protein